MEYWEIQCKGIIEDAEAEDGTLGGRKWKEKRERWAAIYT